MKISVVTYLRCEPAVVAAMALLVAVSGCARYGAPETLESAPPGPPAVVPTTAAGPPATAFGARRDSVTVEDALGRVLQTNPQLQAAFDRVRAADGSRVQAGAWENPFGVLDVEGIGGDGSGFGESEITVKLGVPLELFGTRGLRLLEAEAHVAQQRARYQEVRRELAERTWRAFHRALGAREVVRIARARMSVTGKTAATVRAQVEAGKASPLAGSRADVESATARAAFESARAGFHVAREELMALWQETDADSLVLVGELRSTSPVGGEDREWLAGELSSRHPGLLAARWEVERARRAERLASRERWPDIVPNAGARWDLGSDSQDFVAGLWIELPFLDRRGGARHAAARRIEAAGHDVSALRMTLISRLHTVLEELEARERVLAVYADDIVPQAQRALALARIGYDGGKLGYIDLLDAQRTVIDVEDGRAQALIAFDRALVQLESLLGRRLSNQEEKP